MRKLDANRNSLRKTKVISPIDGEIETQIVAPGDYVKLGDPLFKLVGTQRLHAHLPFPESAAPRLKVGQLVRLTSPLGARPPPRGEASTKSGRRLPRPTARST